MSKKEARIERKLAKQLKEQEKSARLKVQVESQQVPRAEANPITEKLPRSERDPVSIMQMRMEYRIHEHADREGAWSWGEQRNWCHSSYGPDNACVVRATMIAMSGLHWHEIMSQTTGGNDRHKKHHAQSWDTLCPEAQERWMEIERVEEELFRFRTGGKQRIWGFRTGHVFNMVWWDAEHKIYPVD
ncbi:hypothetical protein [Agrobacterium sp. 10MFCol1.1]|uniref:hypothetical protein n=1 Tax=Agrobacterium sp. 10MFCol1.1 TaxID=1150775 RepID=UPI000367A51C|nr:hypothetical protein [Agrobacterium sp. 10MFCol1.1]